MPTQATADRASAAAPQGSLGPARRPHRRRQAAVVAAALAGGTVLSVAAPLAASASSTPGHPHKASGNCAASPSRCGLPDASNTGVPAGASVLKNVPSQVSSGKGWHFDSRGWVQVDGNGAVLNGLNIPCNVNVTASNVTISNSRITVSGESSIGVSLRHTSNVTITHNVITGVNSTSGRMMAGVKDIYGDSAGLSVVGNNIMDASTGVQLESGLVQGNYIHSPGYLPGDHINGITSNGGKPGLLTITGNTILNSMNQTDAIGLFEDFGSQANRMITGNLLAGGGYPIYAGQNTGGAATAHIVVTNNRISTLYFANGGQWGPVTAFNAGGTGNSWSGNVWDGTGAALPAP